MVLIASFTSSAILNDLFAICNSRLLPTNQIVNCYGRVRPIQGAPCFCFALNLLAHGSRLHFSNIPPDHHSESNQHRLAGRCRCGIPHRLDGIGLSDRRQKSTIITTAILKLNRLRSVRYRIQAVRVDSFLFSPTFWVHFKIVVEVVS